MRGLDYTIDPLNSVHIYVFPWMTQGLNLSTPTYHLTDLGPAASLLICETATSPPTLRVELNEFRMTVRCLAEGQH